VQNSAVNIFQFEVFGVGFPLDSYLGFTPDSLKVESHSLIMVASLWFRDSFEGLDTDGCMSGGWMKPPSGRLDGPGMAT